MFSLEDIRVPKGSSTSRPFSFDKFYYVNERKDEEYEDIRVLRIADQIHKICAELGMFFSVNSLPQSIHSSRLLIAVGVPSHLLSIDYATPHIHAATVTLPCSYDSKMIGSVGMHRLKVLRTNPIIPKELKLDGMSGGGVFSIDGNLGDLSVNFRGLILRGGNDNIYMIDISFIREMIEKLDTPTPPRSSPATLT